MSKVYNKSTQLVELAEQCSCPRCSGMGATTADRDDVKCYVCGGKGAVWRATNDSGWCRHIGKKLEQSFLY